jgi:hypothetical protein
VSTQTGSVLSKDDFAGEMELSRLDILDILGLRKVFGIVEMG